MSVRLHTKAAPAPGFIPAQTALLQRRRTLSNSPPLLLQRHPMQAKLRINQPGDIYEQEADRVAQQMVSSPPLHCKCKAPCPLEDENKKLVQRKNNEVSTGTCVSNDLIRNLGPGQPLNPAMRAFFEPRFVHDFSKVRVYSYAQAAEAARAVNARAFTAGKDVVFGMGEYAPGTGEGRRLLAHELTHVVQQNSSGCISRMQLKEAEEITYIVKPGDTIAKIANAFGITIEKLVASNAAKVKTWSGARGNIQGFNVGESIIIPAARAPMYGKPTEKKTEERITEGITEPLKTAWDFWKRIFTGDKEEKTEPKTGTKQPPSGLKDPTDVITHHNNLGTFGKGVNVKFTSTKRDSEQQLKILKNYCESNRSKINDFVDKTDWIRDELDWEKFKKCSLSDENIWLPFFMALFYGGGGPGVKSNERTLPLVASPVQKVWKGRDGINRNANASPHIAGKAMDVKDGDLKALDKILKEKVSEFGKNGNFPISSTQIENVSGQQLIHINFKNQVF